MENAGYIPIATFILPENCWIDHYHLPQIPVQDKFLKKHHDNKTAIDFIAYQRQEAQLYSKYKAFYGYVFYIGKKT